MDQPQGSAFARPLAPAVVSELREVLGGRLQLSEAIRQQHGSCEAHFETMPPDAVAFPHSTEETARLVQICARHAIPVIPYGAGSSLEGQVVATTGGLCIDLSEMNRIVAVHAADLDCTVQAGVTREQLNEYLRDQGLFFPIDPGANATIGGMAATRASGTNAVRYGTMRDAVLSLTAVMPDGRIVRTARRARKSSAGYDLTRLLIGSEGTLGIITEVTLRLHGIPDAISSAVCAFDTLQGAVDTVITAIQLGVPVARIELVDEVGIGAINSYAKLDLEEKPTLFFEFHGTKASVDEQVEIVREIAIDLGGGEFVWSNLSEERSRLWKARHQAYYAGLSLRPGSTGWATDVCVPISRLADCILETRADLDTTQIPTPIVGHVGDGNFHVLFVLDPASEEEAAEAARLNDRLVARALAMDGTCTGEHGIGLGKQQWLIEEHGPGVDIMRLIKRALDPGNLFNPGKIFAMP
ncbi:FAD-binding oxidoreductase [Novosphingobium album (ex Hu et al. 2023)]|uniref:D-lactate dehydrogenase (cytochrome) n=1 Tax=Novosphingobium album (ex Hu et al. 2023) TaxID=2930093 RepID=A0ABT0B6S9_9SPHN|nr:FAD-linked oxidase C-terminal domain-containing protein [Novosphingobium album (ex Hu et al. 2023)]MCJ2180739.1 FAD-binding protein [Novosphingobium album (ex Hu et al. 2023)]